MGVARYVHMAYVSLGLLAYVVLAALFAWALMFFGSAANGQVIGHNFRVADLVGLAVAGGLVIWLLYKLFSRKSFKDGADGLGQEDDGG